MRKVLWGIRLVAVNQFPFFMARWRTVMQIRC